MKEQCVLYARVSTKEQAEEGYSIDAQLRFLHDYANKKGLSITKEFVEAESAKQAGREQFEEMLTFLNRNKSVKTILVEKTDRLTRNFVDNVRIDPKRSGISIHFAKEGKVLTPKSNPNDFFMQDIHVAMASYYSHNLGREASKGMAEKARQGLYPSMAPFGYVNNRNSGMIEPDPVNAHFVTTAFELASTGMYSLALLCERLFEQGLRTKSGRRWTASSMQELLKRLLYSGSFEWNGEVFQGKHQPLVSPELFDRVQVLMGYRQKPKLVKHTFLFSGIFTCGKCGCAITPELKIKPSGRQYVYYHCTNGKKICAVKPSVAETKLDEAICNAIATIRITPDIIEWTREALKASFEGERQFIHKQHQNLSTRRTKLQRLIDQAYEDKVEGMLTVEEWREKTNAWKREQVELEAQLARSREYNLDYMLEGVRTLELAEKAPTLYKSMTVEEKRELIHIVLSNPKLTDGNLDFSWKKPFEILAGVCDLKEWQARKDSNHQQSDLESDALPLELLAYETGYQEVSTSFNKVKTPMLKLAHTGTGRIFYATRHSAGFDICAAVQVTLAPGEWTLVDSGLRIVEDAGPQPLALRPHTVTVIPELQIRPRSGLAVKHGITILNTPSTIDADYRGPIKIPLINHSKVPFEIQPGDRIAQGVCALVMQIPDVPVDDKVRGEGGFGSTGV